MSPSVRPSPGERPPLAGAAAPADAAVPAATLVRALGVWGLAASIFNVTVGGGIFRLPASAAAMIGPAAPLVYLVCAAVMGLIVLCFAEAGSRVSLTGGPYAYVETVFGPYAGFLAGVLVWMLGTGAVASVATAYAGSVAALVPALGAPAARAAVLVATFALLAWINARGVRQGARLIEVVSVAKLLPLLVLVGVGAFFVRPANLAIPAMPGGGEFARAAIVLIFAFTGVESALVPSGEVRDPARTVPRALAIAMIGVTLLYLGVHLVAQGVLGGAGLAAAKDAPLAAAAGGRARGPAGRYLLLVGATVSMFGYASGMTLAIPRALYTFGRDGFLPRVVGGRPPAPPHPARGHLAAVRRRLRPRRHQLVRAARGDRQPERAPPLPRAAPRPGWSCAAATCDRPPASRLRPPRRPARAGAHRGGHPLAVHEHHAPGGGCSWAARCSTRRSCSWRPRPPRRDRRGARVSDRA
jgi:hypothetical protein